jgi:hypothetical protein
MGEPSGFEKWWQNLGGKSARGSRAKYAGQRRLDCQRDRVGRLSARLVQAEMKRIWPKAGKSGRNRRVRKPSQTACASANSVARRAQS